MMNTIIKQNMLQSKMTQIQLIQALLVLVEIPLQVIINNLVTMTRLQMMGDQVDQVELEVVDQEIMEVDQEIMEVEIMDKMMLLMIIPKLQMK